MNLEFRIWNKKNKLFSEYGERGDDRPIVHLENLLLHGKGFLCLVGGGGICPANDDDFVIQKFTGSLDKKNRQIFEGDIVLWHTEDPFDCSYHRKKMIVGWSQRCMQYRLYDSQDKVGKEGGEQFWAEDVEVIGHIFDYKNEQCRYHLDDSVKNLVKPLEPKFEKDGENWKEIV